MTLPLIRMQMRSHICSASVIQCVVNTNELVLVECLVSDLSKVRNFNLATGSTPVVGSSKNSS